MVREPLTASARERGGRLGEVLRQARGSRSIVEVAAKAGVSAETLRKIERGHIPTPAFFTVVAIVDVLGLSLDALMSQIGLQTEPGGPPEPVPRGGEAPTREEPVTAVRI